MKNKTTETGEQAAKREASLLKIHIVFIYILFWLMQNNGSLFPKKGRGLLGVNQGRPKPKVKPRCIR